MFLVGENVVYGMHGVCAVLGVEIKKVDNCQMEYYVLEPHNQASAKYYVPKHNSAAMSKIRSLITRHELDELLHSDLVRTDSWIEDENKRKLCYRKLISSGDREALLQMIHTLYMRKNMLEITGKRLHICDDGFLQDAKKILDSEFSYVLGIEPEDVAGYVTSVLNE